MEGMQAVEHTYQGTSLNRVGRIPDFPRSLSSRCCRPNMRRARRLVLAVVRRGMIPYTIGHAA
jgi:hypothetical protein